MLATSLASLAFSASSSCVDYRKITDGECADACIDSTVGICPRSIVVSAGGLDAGKCADVGYAVADGSIDQQAGPCGTIHFNQYKTSAVLSLTASDVSLVTFDGASGTTFAFSELNDPVMGGQSSGTWSLGSEGFGVMDGQVLDVPSLKAPGFIKAAADGTFADASTALGGDLLLEVRSTTPEYKGFRVTFASGTLSPSYACSGGGSIPLSRGCFKANFSVPSGDAFTTVRIPFDKFSDKWSPATGEQTTTCAADSDVCPKASTLAAIKRFELWAEGADGKVHLEVKSIRAAPKQAALRMLSFATLSSSPPKDYMTCSSPIQPSLRFGVSGRTTPTVPVAVDANESLADAVCCDSRVKPFAEPQFLFQAPDILLFQKLDADGINTFFDSVCGLPLFRAPINRTFAEFEADTNEHGWPSFRPAEVVDENVVTDVKTGYVTSKCGTHLGSYLPDTKGPRWCMDLSCISGVASEEDRVTG